jgi:hypothetical protein
LFYQYILEINEGQKGKTGHFLEGYQWEVAEHKERVKQDKYG